MNLNIHEIAQLRVVEHEIACALQSQIANHTLRILFSPPHAQTLLAVVRSVLPPAKKKVKVYRFTYTCINTPYIAQHEDRAILEQVRATKHTNRFIKYSDVSEITEHEQEVTER